MSEISQMIDLTAREFLTAYAYLFLFLIVALFFLRLRMQREWSKGVDCDKALTDDELALIAGGWPRVSLLMVLRLLHKECVQFRKSFIGKATLVCTADEGNDLSEGDRCLLGEIKRRGKRGVRLKELVPVAERYGIGMEESLATRGIRAVRSEVRSLRSKLIWAPILFAVVGAVRVYQGIQRDEPFTYVVSMGVIGVALLLLLSKVEPVTRRGRRVYKERKRNARNAVSGGVADALTAYACLGWIGIAGTTFAKELGDETTRYFYNSTSNSSSWSGDSDSGDSDSGGGCGGCGGCGGD